MNVIIIDDEQEAIRCIKQLLNIFCPQVSICGTANNINESISIIKNQKPDLVIVDVELQNENGFSLLEKFPERDFQVVFMALNESYALQALRLNALDYLLKPIDPDLLVNCIGKAKKIVKEKLYPDYEHLLKKKAKPLDRLGISTCTGVKYIDLQNILYLRSHDNYTEVFIEKCKSVLVSKPLKSFEKILKNTSFSRVHQSFLVNINKVIEVQKMGGGFLILRDNIKIPISRSKKENIKKRLEKTWKLI